MQSFIRLLSKLSPFAPWRCQKFVRDPHVFLCTLTNFLPHPEPKFSVSKEKSIYISLWVCLIFCVDTKTSDVYCGDLEERSELLLSQPTSSHHHLHEQKTFHKKKKPKRSSKALLSLQQDVEMPDEGDMLEKRTNFAKKAVKFFIQQVPTELSDNDFNPFAVHPAVVKKYCLTMYDDFFRETTSIGRTNTILVLDRVHITYCHQLDGDFFQKDPRWQIWARRIVGVPGGFFASSAACALFMKFVADYFEIPTSEDASLGTVIFLCATTSPFIMVQLSESTNEFLNGIKRICSNQQELTGYYFKREPSHKMMHTLTHLLSLGKASVIAGVVYNIEQPYGGWAYPFAIGAFLSQYELTVRPEITTTDRLAQKHAKKFSMLREMLLEKLEKFETTINSSEESFQAAYSQIYPSGEVNYSRFAQFFLPIREIPLAGDHDEPSTVHVRRQAHFSNEAADFVQDLSSLKSFSFWDIPIEGCRFAIISFGNYGRFLIYGHFLTPLLPQPIAYTASTLITLMQWYSEDIIHQENSYDLSQRLSKFTTNLRGNPCRTIASTVCSAVKESPKVFPVVAVAALSSVVPAIGQDALTSQDPITRKIIVVSTGLLDFSVLTSLIKRTAMATKATASSIVMGAFGKCFERVARRLERHTQKTQLQADIARARKAIESEYNNQTIEVISTLVRKEEGRGN